MAETSIKPTIVRTINGKEVTIKLTDEEISEIYYFKEKEFLKEGIGNELDNLEIITMKLDNGKTVDVPTSLFKNEKFSELVSSKIENESYTKHIENIVESNESTEFLLKNVESTLNCTDYIDLFSVDCRDGDNVIWYQYNPDAQSGGQILAISFDDRMLIGKEFKNYKECEDFILSHKSADVYDFEDDAESFLNKADDIAQTNFRYTSFEELYNERYNVQAACNEKVELRGNLQFIYDEDNYEDHDFNRSCGRR